MRFHRFCSPPALLLPAILLLLASGPLAGAAQAGLDATEQRIVDAVGEREGEALALLERAVEENSGTMNLDGVGKVGEIFRAEFDELGFQTRWIDGEGFERAGHLVATHDGSGVHFLLIGHLDTVFEPDSPFQHFERVSEHEARGPGITDMKGGVVVLLEALRALRGAGVLDRMRVTVFLTGDEERPGRPLEAARREFVEAARAADYALGFEDGDSDPRTAVISRRGSSSWTLRATGTPAHSSQIFSEPVGYGAVYELARVLDAFREQLAGEELLSFSPGLVLGGSELSHDRASASGTAYGKNNVVAREALATGDLRTFTPEQLERVRQRMREIVASPLSGTHSEIEFDAGYPPLAPTEGNRRLLALYSAISEELGLDPVEAVDPARAGAADISFCSGLVDGALCGLGLMGSGGHTVEETADLRTLVSQSERAALLMWRLSR